MSNTDAVHSFLFFHLQSFIAFNSSSALILNETPSGLLFQSIEFHFRMVVSGLSVFLPQISGDDCQLFQAFELDYQLNSSNPEKAWESAKILLFETAVLLTFHLTSINWYRSVAYVYISSSRVCFLRLKVFPTSIHQIIAEHQRKPGTIICWEIITGQMQKCYKICGQQQKPCCPAIIQCLPWFGWVKFKIRSSNLSLKNGHCLLWLGHFGEHHFWTPNTTQSLELIFEYFHWNQTVQHKTHWISESHTFLLAEVNDARPFKKKMEILFIYGDLRPFH